MADSKVREPLGEERQAQPATYFISPDEQWIFAHVHYGSGMGGARLYQRKKDFRSRYLLHRKTRITASLPWRSSERKIEI